MYWNFFKRIHFSQLKLEEWMVVGKNKKGNLDDVDKIPMKHNTYKEKICGKDFRSVQVQNSSWF